MMIGVTLHDSRGDDQHDVLFIHDHSVDARDHHFTIFVFTCRLIGRVPSSLWLFLHRWYISGREIGL